MRALVFIGLCLLPPSAAQAAPQITWAGGGDFRILVEVPPRDLTDRSDDGMPAEIALDFLSELRKSGANAEDRQPVRITPPSPRTRKARQHGAQERRQQDDNPAGFQCVKIHGVRSSASAGCPISLEVGESNPVCESLFSEPQASACRASARAQACGSGCHRIREAPHYPCMLDQASASSVPFRR